MRAVVVGAVALLAGLFLGGLGPRREVRRLTKELADAKAAAERAEGAGAMLPLALGALGAVRERAAEPARPVPRFVTPPPGEEARPREEARERRRRPPSEALAAMKMGMEVRAIQHRESFIAEAKLPPAKVEALDALIDKMNQELTRVANEAAEKVALDRKPAPRDFVALGAKLAEVYLRADEALRGSLDPAALAALDRTEFDLTTQIDPGAFLKLAERADALRPRNGAP